MEPYRVGFEGVLAGMGYTPLSAVNQVGVMRHLSLWLEGRGLAASGLVPVVVQRAARFLIFLHFQASRRRLALSRSL